MADDPFETTDPLDEIIKEAFERASRFHKELGGESPRAAAILAAANFEDILQAAITDKFVPLNQDMKKDIFTRYGPLSTFSAKIDIAYALGLYGPKTRANLIDAKFVRNKFAHTSEPIQFSDETIAKRCRKLTPDSLPNPRA